MNKMRFGGCQASAKNNLRNKIVQFILAN